ncbi:MAG: glycosyl transferase, family 51, partial [Blastococcus sp.]|nr:glycosyl transferase, family 51 [Blastococcus sp.]
MRRPSWKKLVLGGLGGGVLGAVLLVGAGYALTDIPEPSESATQQATRILYADRSELGRIGKQNRIEVPLDKVSDDAEHAVLAAEDRGFYTEPGVSPRGIARALFANVQGGGVEQGGSTITQQYAKNAFLTSERTFTRKVKEVFIALKMTRERTKEQILEDYLNTIYFGRGAYGIQAATETYFGGGSGSAQDLSVAQAAVLAASIRSPAAYDPERHPQRAKDRWNYVLDGMVATGWLTAEDRAAQKYPFVRSATKDRAEERKGPKGYIIAKVEEELAAKGAFTEEQLAAGGLVVQTTLRREAQEAAERAVEEVVPEPTDPQTSVQGALVAVKPGTGEVFAYYGGRSGNGGFDYASDGLRQPGSSFKPYVLAAALKDGISLRSRFNGNNLREFDGRAEPVENFDDRSFGRIDLVKATEDSVNTVYVDLADRIGPDKVAEVAHAAGIPASVKLAEQDGGKPSIDIGLGPYEVHVIDQAVGFATFAAKGVAAEPFLVKSVRQGDEVVYTARIRTSRALDEGVAADTTYALRQVIEDGTGTRARLEERPAAGKTGTSSNNRDAWFVGFTPQLSAAVWLGRPRGTLNGTVAEGEVTGGRVSAAIWKQFMDAALEGQEALDFPARADIGEVRGSSGGATVTDGESARERRRRRSAPPEVQQTQEALPSPAPSPEPEPTRQQPS